MDIEDYFIIALIFAIIAYASNSVSYGYFFNNYNNGGSVEQTLGMYTFSTELNLLIVLPSAYIAIAFTIGGFIKASIKGVKFIIKKKRQEDSGQAEGQKS
jgi:hypothetical protein